MTPLVGTPPKIQAAIHRLMQRPHGRVWSDVLWFFVAPCSMSGVSFVSDAWFEERVAGLLDRLEEESPLEKEIAHLAANRGRQRLGKYFEAILELGIRLCPDIVVVGSNLQLRQQGDTLGEFDLVLRQRNQHTALHLELALKFYMQNDANVHQYIGPNTRDSLADKLQKLHTHQLPLAQHSAARGALQSLGAWPVQSLGVFKGFFFYPWGPIPQPDEHFTSNHLRGWWMRFSTFCEVQLPGDFFLCVEKIDWFSLFPPDQEPSLLPATRLRAWMLQRMAIFPNAQMLVCFDTQGTELSRGFVVPDSWPGFAF